MHPSLWSDLFIPGLPIIDKILRAVIVYVFLVVALKLAGRRELAQLNAFDLVVLLTIANTVQDAIIGNDNSVVGGLISATTFLVANYLLVRVAFQYSKTHRKKGEPGEVLIEHGKVREEVVKKELITMDELQEAASREGFESLRDVERAALNSDGTFAFVGKKKPQADGREYHEILRRLDRLAEQMARLRPPESSPQT